MQSSRIYPVFSLTKPNYVFRRLITAKAAEVKEDVPLKSWREIPGPSSLPIIGPLAHVLPGDRCKYSFVTTRCPMKEHFPRSKEFIPERWISEKDDPLNYKHAHPFAYDSFGFGVRGCVGRRIAELELETFLAHLMANFQVEWFGPPIKVQSTSLNYMNYLLILFSKILRSKQI